MRIYLWIGLGSALGGSPIFLRDESLNTLAMISRRQRFNEAGENIAFNLGAVGILAP